jgi:hypothetical protein
VPSTHTHKKKAPITDRRGSGDLELEWWTRYAPGGLEGEISCFSLFNLREEIFFKLFLRCHFLEYSLRPPKTVRLEKFKTR